MPRKKADPIVDPSKVYFPPAASDEAREQEIISLAYDLAEKQLREGTASSQLIHFFVKQGSRRDRLEREIMAEQKKLVTAKTGAIEDGRVNRQLFEEAISAMRRYQGLGSEEPNENENLF